MNCHKIFKRSSPTKSIKVWFAATGILALFSPILLNLSVRGITQLLPQYDGQSIESIIVLGRGSDSQTERALVVSQLWSDRPSMEVFVSGMTDAPPILKALTEMGVPEQQMSGERCSQTTWENGLFSATVLDSKKVKRVLLVTDEPHMLRAFLVFKGFGFDVTTHAIKAETAQPFSLKSAQITLREYAALFAYGISGKLRSKSLVDQQADSAEAQNKIDLWKCQL